MPVSLVESLPPTWLGPFARIKYDIAVMHYLNGIEGTADHACLMHLFTALEHRSRIRCYCAKIGYLLYVQHCNHGIQLEVSDIFLAGGVCAVLNLSPPGADWLGHGG